MTTVKDTKLRDLLNLLTTADTYLDVFGEDTSRVAGVYRNMARFVHPDAGGDTEAFQKLNQFKADADQMIEQGRYGERVLVATIRSRKATHKVIRRVGSGDICDLYETKTQRADDMGPGVTGFMKVARKAWDNDLLAAEAKAVKHLRSVDDMLTRHVPVLLDSFMYSDGRRRANVFENQPGYTAEMVRYLHNRGGTDPRHMVWIFRRLLMGLGFAHDHGVIHGAVVPSHILIEPVDHKVILLDWCYSSMQTADAEGNPKFSPVKAVVTNFKDLYPEEVLEKESPSPATDLCMAARSMVYLMGSRAGNDFVDMPVMVPRGIRAFLKGCMLEKQDKRPQNAWETLAMFDRLLENMGVPYHPRRFEEFRVPTGTDKGEK